MYGACGPHRICPTYLATERTVPAPQGYLSNLGELVDELCYRSFSELGTSYESEFGRGSFQPLSGGDQAMLAAEVLLHMYLQASDPNELTILLSELQVPPPPYAPTLTEQRLASDRS